MSCMLDKIYQLKFWKLNNSIFFFNNVCFVQGTVTVPLIMYMPDKINWSFETLTNLAHRDSRGEFMLYPGGLDLVNVFGAGPLSKLLPVLHGRYI